AEAARVARRNSRRARGSTGGPWRAASLAKRERDMQGFPVRCGTGPDPRPRGPDSARSIPEGGRPRKAAIPRRPSPAGTLAAQRRGGRGPADRGRGRFHTISAMSDHTTTSAPSSPSTPPTSAASPGAVPLRELVEQYRQTEQKLRLGGGPKAIERQHAKGRLTARERVQ